MKYLFHPRDEKIVLMGAWSGKRFSDNTRFLYQYLSEHKTELGLTHVVWVSREVELVNELVAMGYEAYEMESEESIYYHKRAKYHIICNSANAEGHLQGDILVQYSCGAIKVNLWHGLGGIKGVEFAGGQYARLRAAHPLKCKTKEFFNRLKWYRILLNRIGGWGDCRYATTTPWQTEILMKYFMRPKNYFVPCGYPRNGQCLAYCQNEQEVLALLKERNNRILYLPTFRDSNANYQEPLQDAAFREWIKQRDVLWIEKAHGADTSALITEEGKEGLPILKLDSTFDVNVILSHVDVIVTDYSSVVWDGIYHRKPLVFYVPDLNYYRDEDRGFMISPEEFMLGEVTYSIGELQGVLEQNQSNYQRLLVPNLEEVRTQVWGRDMDYKEIWSRIQNIKK
ncbi:MAG: CDP-glycerol glycerophosphotransferase family protein [Agathobacter sp.]|nr:CDP-glycerol glycerophosphotransferase family protein [Agathobacter sp.]